MTSMTWRGSLEERAAEGQFRLWHSGRRDKGRLGSILQGDKIRKHVDVVSNLLMEIDLQNYGVQEALKYALYKLQDEESQ